MEMPEANESGNNFNNSLPLASREERAALIKNGLTVKDIESLYLSINGIQGCCLAHIYHADYLGGCQFSVFQDF